MKLPKRWSRKRRKEYRKTRAYLVTCHLYEFIMKPSFFRELYKLNPEDMEK